MRRPTAITTELNYVANQATLEGYRKSGVKHYKFLAALDSRTSELCRKTNGQVFVVAEAKVGVNFPPLHPNCRSTTVAHFTDEDLAERYDFSHIQLSAEELAELGVSREDPGGSAIELPIELRRMVDAELENIRQGMYLSCTATVDGNSTEVVMTENWPQFMSVCPYCQSELKKRTPPQKNSSFACPTCLGSIQARPRQNAFRSSYLTTQQAERAEVAMRLRRYPFDQLSMATPAAYERKRLQLKGIAQQEPEVEEVVWELALDAVAEAKREQHSWIREDISKAVADIARVVGVDFEVPLPQKRIVSETHQADGFVSFPVAQQEQEPSRPLDVDDAWPVFDPTCPYCKGALPDSEPPATRVELPCPLCRGRVHVYPQQNAYPSIYLTTEQARFVELTFLVRRPPFDRLSIATEAAYWAKRLELKRSTNREPEVSEVVLSLAQEALIEARRLDQAGFNRVAKAVDELEQTIGRPFRPKESFAHPPQPATVVFEYESKRPEHPLIRALKIILLVPVGILGMSFVIAIVAIVAGPRKAPEPAVVQQVAAPQSAAPPVVASVRPIVFAVLEHATLSKDELDEKLRGKPECTRKKKKREHCKWAQVEVSFVDGRAEAFTLRSTDFVFGEDVLAQLGLSAQGPTERSESKLVWSKHPQVAAVEVSAKDGVVEQVLVQLPAPK